jgi:DNA-binding Lrp family transcriptional regulator
MAKPPAKPPAKPKAPPRKAPASKPKAAAQPDPKKSRKAQPKPAPKKADRRGCPKGKGAVAGRNGGQIGQPPFVATAEQRKLVETHAAVGTPHEIIAELLSISADTLGRHFEKELRLGLIKVNARIGAQVAKKALEGSAKHEFFWLKTRGGYRIGMAIEHAGPGGGPIPHGAPMDIDFSKLSREEKRALEALMAKAAANEPPAA